MSEFTKSVSSNDLDERLIKMRTEYKKNGIPTILSESLNILLTVVSVKRPDHILEIGTATGCSGIAMLSKCQAKLTTVEIEESSYLTAKANFSEFGLTDRVTQIIGDSLVVLDNLTGEYDFVFMDGSKSKYIDCLNKIEPHLTKNAVIVSDNVLFRGYVDGSVKCPHKYNTIKRKMTEYLNYMCNGGKYYTTVLDVGDGVAVSVLK